MKTIYTVIVSGTISVEKRLLLEKRIEALMVEELGESKAHVLSHEMDIHDLDTVNVRSSDCAYCRDTHSIVVANWEGYSRCPSCGSM